MNKNEPTSYLRKQIYFSLLYIGLGLIPLFILDGKKDILFRIIKAGGVLFSLYKFILLVGIIPMLIEDFSQDKNVNLKKGKNKKNKEDKPVYTTLEKYMAIFLILSCLFLIFEIRKMENLIEETKFFWTFASIGILIGVFILLLIKVISPSQFLDYNRKLTLISGVITILFILSPAIASFFNRNFADSSPYYKQFLVSSKYETGAGRHHDYTIELSIEDREVHFDITKSSWVKLNEGEQANCLLITGKLGFVYIKEFRPVE